jgi:hypothetical protein
MYALQNPTYYDRLTLGLTTHSDGTTDGTTESDSHVLSRSHFGIFRTPLDEACCINVRQDAKCVLARFRFSKFYSEY